MAYLRRRKLCPSLFVKNLKMRSPNLLGLARLIIAENIQFLVVNNVNKVDYLLPFAT